MKKTGKRNAKLAARVQKTAEITGFSTDYVYMVIKGERKNEDVTHTYSFLHDGENKLVHAAKKLLGEM